VARITEAQRATYAELGTVRIEGVFDPAFVARMTAIVDDSIAALRSGRLPKRETADPVFRDIEFEDHDGYVRLVNLMPRMPRLRELLLDSPAAATVGELIGAQSLRIWLDATFSKVGVAAETATPWHNDECTFTFQGEQMPSLWIALTDVDERNSPLVTLAGSHRDRVRYHSPFLPSNVERPDDYRPWTELLGRVAAPDADLRTWTARAGDVLVIHPRTIHGAPARQAGVAERRLAFTVRWVGSDVRWRPNPLTFGLSPFDRHPLMLRDAPPPEELFPVVWRRAPAARPETR
jgi:ectoine hydroxylase-related dioxygenase (phytanoyl-CoA dioxygenase family)